MTMQRRALLLVPIALVLSACSSLSSPSAPAHQTATTWTESSESGDRAHGATPRLETLAANQSVRVEDVVEANQAVRDLVAALGGRVSSASTGNEDSAHFALRIPAESLDRALDAFAALGEENHRRIDTEDVTERFADATARRANLAALRDRLRTLLDRAKTVEDVLRVERELTRVQTELDTLDGRLERLRSDITLSRVDLHLQRRGNERVLGPLGWVVQGTRWFVRKLFVLREGS